MKKTSTERQIDVGLVLFKVLFKFTYCFLFNFLSRQHDTLKLPKNLSQKWAQPELFSPRCKSGTTLGGEGGKAERRFFAADQAENATTGR